MINPFRANHRYAIIVACTKPARDTPEPFFGSFDQWWNKHCVPNFTLKFGGKIRITEYPILDKDCVWQVGLIPQKAFTFITYGAIYKLQVSRSYQELYDIENTALIISWKQMKRIKKQWDAESLSTVIGLQISDLVNTPADKYRLPYTRHFVLQKTGETLGFPIPDLPPVVA